MFCADASRSWSCDRTPLRRAHVHDVLVAPDRCDQQRLEPSVQDVRRDRVHEVHLERLGRLDLVQPKPPAVDLAKVDLLDPRRSD